MKEDVLRALLGVVLTFTVLGAAAEWVMARADHDSVAAATAFRSALDAGKLDAFAAEHPEMPGRFIAVLYFPGVQILAMSAVHPAPELLRRLITTADYRQAYLDLSTSAEQEGRLFVQDLGAPGLRVRREDDQPFDITWRDGTRRTTYDADWTAQQLSNAEYHRRFAADDAEYAAMLRVLIEAAQAPPAAAGGQ